MLLPRAAAGGGGGRRERGVLRLLQNQMQLFSDRFTVQ